MRRTTKRCVLHVTTRKRRELEDGGKMTTKTEAIETVIDNCWTAVKRLLDDPGGAVGMFCVMASIEAARVQIQAIQAQPDEPMSGVTVTPGGLTEEGE